MKKRNNGISPTFINRKHDKKLMNNNDSPYHSNDKHPEKKGNASSRDSSKTSRGSNNFSNEQ